MAAPTKIDWIEAEKYFLEDGTRTFREVAKKFGVSSSAVELQAKKNNWVQQRNNLAEQSIAKATDNLAERNAEVNDRHRGMAQALQRLAYEKLIIANRQIDKAKKDAEKNGGLDTLTVYDTGMISESKMKFLADTLLVGINLERVTLGMPITVERKEVTGQNGRDLFADGDKSKILDIVANTIIAIDRGGTTGHNKSDV